MGSSSAPENQTLHGTTAGLGDLTGHTQRQQAAFVQLGRKTMRKKTYYCTKIINGYNMAYYGYNYSLIW